MMKEESYKTLTIQEAYDLLQRREITLVDLRDEFSFKQGHIDKAVLLNSENMNEFLDKTDRKKILMCYCYHGISSHEASKYFVNNGFGQVFHIEGGFKAWQEIYPHHVENE